MKPTRSYRTGLFVSHADAKEPKPPYKGRNWLSRIERVIRKAPISKEIVIQARTPDAAQRALNLILGCLNLCTGEPMVSPGEYDLLVYRDEDLRKLPLNERARYSKSIGTGSVPKACAIAAKASFRLKTVYAISKYNFSISNCSIFNVDLEPHRSRHISISAFPDDHVRFCHAIISGYEVLEELGLEIRASQDHPSMINGEWNPLVKKDLENRLRKAGVDLEETLIWTIRGPKRRIELKKAPLLLRKEEWAKGIMVRDASIELVDAIAYSSWLRSYVASHKAKDITSVLSLYDVINVQHLARRLILEPLGFWRFWEKRS